jgi:ABC-type polar amino acid transport system ATPase subunit
MVFQFHCLSEHLSALDNVCLAPIHAHQVPAAEARRGGIELLKAFGVDHRAHALLRNLSWGEARGDCLRALAVNPPILLMDGRRRHWISAPRELGELIGGPTREGEPTVIATHDEEFARTWATRRLRLESGAVVQDGVK